MSLPGSTRRALDGARSPALRYGFRAALRPAAALPALSAHAEGPRRATMGANTLCWLHVDLKVNPPPAPILIDHLRFAASAGFDGVLIEWENMFPFRAVPEALSSNAYRRSEVERIVGECATLGLAGRAPGADARAPAVAAERRPVPGATRVPGTRRPDPGLRPGELGTARRHGPGAHRRPSAEPVRAPGRRRGRRAGARRPARMQRCS